ncbi:hypothetical protein MNOOCJFK_00113 [Escherichia phage vB_EcoM_01]
MSSIDQNICYQPLTWIGEGHYAQRVICLQKNPCCVMVLK